MAGSDGRILGIDYLRAVFSVCVVAVHLGYVFPSAIFDPESYSTHTFTSSDLVNFYLLCLAVPVFVLVSTYLYALRPTDTAGLGRRVGRIVRLLVFWSVAYQIFFFTGYGVPKVVPRDAEGLGLYLLTGGDTVYYFFVCLALVTVATHAAQRLPGRTVWALFVISTAAVGVLPLAHRSTGWLVLGLHANPLNFLPLAFAGVGLARLTRAGDDRALTRIGLTALGLGAACAVLDWTAYVDPCFFRVNQFALPAYTRPSLVFLSVAVVVWAVRARPTGNAVVRFMARHSLAVYVLHPFFVPVRYKMVDALHLTGAVEVLAPLAVVLGLSYVGSMVLKMFLRSDVLQ
jgi:surface polysaccharide O-acyltransferase-like enzyme